MEQHAGRRHLNAQQAREVADRLTNHWMRATSGHNTMRQEIAKVLGLVALDCPECEFCCAIGLCCPLGSAEQRTSLASLLQGVSVASSD